MFASGSSDEDTSFVSSDENLREGNVHRRTESILDLRFNEIGSSLGQVFPRSLEGLSSHTLPVSPPPPDNVVVHDYNILSSFSDGESLVFTPARP